ncbi:MAG: hypothetical protein JXA21_24690 [Anaerolineae bacterium]|nr:hypothetical protein [Anaerolineae bacterium]
MSGNSVNVEMPCNFQGREACQECAIEGRLMCHYDARDTLNFLMVILPPLAPIIIGVFQAGYAWYLLPWLGYWLIFFFGWEARVLCSHCPMWAEEGRVLRCHANYGVIKFWKYRPGPMSRSEQVQFMIGALIWMCYPIVLAALGGEYLWAGAGLIAAIGSVYNLRKISCRRCIHFSCPLNTVPKSVRDHYIRRNPAIRAAWEAAGRHID